jgi:hypothetical protein
VASPPAAQTGTVNFLENGFNGWADFIRIRSQCPVNMNILAKYGRMALRSPFPEHRFAMFLKMAGTVFIKFQ